MKLNNKLLISVFAILAVLASVAVISMDSEESDAATYTVTFTVGNATGCSATIETGGQTYTATAGSPATVTITQGASVTLTATAGTGYTFSAWNNIQGQMSTSNPYTFNLNSNYGQIMAIFDTASTYTLTLSVGNATGCSATLETGGQTYTATVGSPATVTITRGASVTLTAIEGTGSTFTAWNTPQGQMSTSNPYTFTLNSNYGQIMAIFDSSSTYTLAFTVGNATGCSATLETGGQTYTASAGNPVSVSIVQGASVTITATAGTGYTFSAWNTTQGQMSTSNPYTFTMNSNYGQISALFTANTYTVSFSANTGGSVSSASIADVPYGSAITVDGNRVTIDGATVTATASNGYNFSYWSNTGGTITGDRTITANFSARTYSMTLTVGNATGCSAKIVTGGHTYTATAGSPVTFSVTHGASATLTATNGTGYSFASWQNPQGQMSTSNPYTFTISDNYGQISAVFTQNTYTVSFSANTGGSVSANSIPNVPYGSAITVDGNRVTINGTTVTATPSTNYAFDSWSNASGTVTADRTITASFVVNAYSLTLSVGNATGCSASLTTGGQTYTATAGSPTTVTISQGASVTLNATAGTNYTFAAWNTTQGELSTANPYTFTMNSNYGLITATFDSVTTYTLALSVGNATGCSATLETGGQTYTATVGNPVSVSIVQGSSVTLTAIEGTGSTFTAWNTTQGQMSTSNPYTFTMNSNYGQITATFTTNAYSLTVSVGNATGCSATIETGGQTYTATVGSPATVVISHGASVTLTAIEGTGSTFTAWNTTQGQMSTSNPYTFTMVGNYGLITATFSTDTYTLALSVGNATGCSATLETGGQTYTATAGSPATVTISHGASVTVTATAGTGYIFASWNTPQGQLSTANPYTFTMAGNMGQIMAVFTDNTYTLSFNVQNGATGCSATLETGGQTYTATVGNPVSVRIVRGASVTITATEGTGYTFVAWNSTQGQFSTQNPYTFTMDGNYGQLTATFTTTAYIISFTVGNAIGCSATLETGGQTYTATAGSPATVTISQGASVTVTATAGTGYTFASWQNTQGQMSTSNPYTFTMAGNMGQIRAVFDANAYIVSFTVGEATGCSATIETGGQTYTATAGSPARVMVNHGDSVTLTAIEGTGYDFVSWDSTQGQMSTSNPYTFTMNGNYGQIMATFVSNSYTIVFSVGNYTGCSATLVTDGQTYTATTNNPATVTVGRNASVTITATAGNGFTFSAWNTPQGLLSGTNPYTFTMENYGMIWATFTSSPPIPPPVVDAPWWDNGYINGRVDVAFWFENTSNNMTHEMTIPLVRHDGIEGDADGLDLFSQSGYVLTMTVPYNGSIEMELSYLGDAVATASYQSGTWMQFTISIDAQSGKVTFNGTRSLGWNAGQKFTFTNYDTVFSTVIFDFSDTAKTLAINQIYHEDVGTGTNHVRFQVSATTTYLDTHGYVMNDPRINIHDYFPEYQSIRLNLYSFAVYGDSMTLNGRTFHLDGSKITDLYYVKVTENVYGDPNNPTKVTGQNTYYEIADASDPGAILYQPTLSNIYITWEGIESSDMADRQCYLTFVDAGITINMGSFVRNNASVSFSGIWYFTTAVWEPYTATEKSYSMDFNNWFNLDSNAFILVVIALLIVLTVVFNIFWKPSLIDYAIIFGGAIISYIMLGGL